MIEKSYKGIISKSPYIEPTATLNIEENGLFDVLNYRFANVAVAIPEGYLKPEGTIEITSTSEVDVTQYAKAKIKDENLKAENIAENVEVLGIIGTFKGGIDTSDATASANDISLGKTAYVNNEKIVGTMAVYGGDYIDLVSNLPDEYMQLQYIESTGTQFINTGFVPNTNTKAELHIGGVNANSFPTTSGGWFIGSRTAYLQATFGTYYNPSNQSLYGGFGNQQPSKVISTSEFYDKDHLFIIDKNGLYLDEEKVLSFTSSFNGEYPLYLFTINLAGARASILSFKLYYCKLWDGETLVRDFIPCKRISDDVVGLYDTVTNEFYSNVDAENFAGG